MLTVFFAHQQYNKYQYYTCLLVLEQRIKSEVIFRRFRLRLGRFRRAMMFLGMWGFRRFRRGMILSALHMSGAPEGFPCNRVYISHNSPPFQNSSNKPPSFNAGSSFIIFNILLAESSLRHFSSLKKGLSAASRREVSSS